MKLEKKIFLLLFHFFFVISAFGQKNQFSDTIKWESPILYGLEGEEKKKCLYFEGAQYNYSINNLPFFYEKLEISKGAFAKNINIVDYESSRLTSEEVSLIDEEEIPTTIKVEVENGVVRKQNHAYLYLSPFFRDAAGSVFRINSFTIEVEFERMAFKRNKSLSYASQSKLSSGEWYKIATTKQAVYKLNSSFLKELGIDVESVDPRSIRLFGYGGGMLPAANSKERPDDLQEMAIYVKGENDGVFNKNDYVAFYGEEQVQWTYDSINSRFNHKKHNYSDSVYYFINVNETNGKRINIESNALTPNTQVNSFDDYAYHEKDEVNFLKSGIMWFGETFDNQTVRDFMFSFPNVDQQEQASVRVGVVGRSGRDINSVFTISSAGSSKNLNVGWVILNNYQTTYANYGNTILNFTPNSDNVQIRVAYNKPQAVARGWLDYISVSVRRSLVYENNQLFFRDVRSVGNGNVSQFNIQSIRDLKVWDLTDKFNIKEKTVNRNGNQLSIVSETEELKEFVAFSQLDSSNVYAKGRVPNQNLHAMSQADMLIVTHPLFLSQSEELANIHRDEGLSVNVVTAEQIYNEFSSGAQDPIAIRTFAKMFYDRAANEAEMPKYLLIFGDASYDFKDRIRGNTNFVVSFQSTNSLEPVKSYVSDDYMALLDDDEGEWLLSGQRDKIDLGVGRFPVRNSTEANAVLNKVKAYYSAGSAGEWRNTITFAADDGDNNLHMIQANNLATLVESKEEGYVFNKIFLDAYQKVSTPAGQRCPDMNSAIDRAVLNGSFIVNYTGHGGETGWTAERVLDIPSILSWDNLDKLSLFVTATCEFSRFDDPLRTSAGELVLLNPNGGGVALLTTTRLVYANQNYWLNYSFYNRLFERNVDGGYKRLGDVAREVKNNNASQDNTRNFSLLGDPALRLRMPEFEVVTTHINNNDIGQQDTVSALSEVSVKGYLVNSQGSKLSNYNGVLYSTVFDKAVQKKTLGQTKSAMPYSNYESRIFKGKATVNNGGFEFKFIVPKDIAYNYGNGKLTYYSANNNQSANGEFKEFVIGGSNDSAIADNNGPEIELYLNDRSFVYGGITNDQPVLLADLSDELGLNTVGNGIGHDIVAIIDEDTENTIVLNDYYEANVDDYKAGEIRFPLDKLSEGKHTLTLKAWDVANNSSQKTIEFNVVNEKDVEIQNLVNYPNPFTTNTEFIFQHNQPGIPLDVKLEIFTVSGKLVKSFDQIIVNEGFLSRDIRWDGRDDFGDRIAKGVYVYKLKIRSGNGSTAEKIEKLVIL